jgi:uncharacterized protein YlxP (DUF503 family)
LRYDPPLGSPRAGLVTASLYLPGCGSLKGKRSRLRRLLRDMWDLRISAAEVGTGDRTDAAVIACAVVSSDWSQTERQLRRALQLLHANPEVEVVDSRTERLI